MNVPAVLGEPSLEMVSLDPRELSQDTRRVRRHLKELKTQERWTEILELTRRLCRRDIGYLALTRMVPYILEARHQLSVVPNLKVALLGTSTTRQLSLVTQALLHGRGFHAEVYESEYDSLEAEILDAGSSFHAFGADVVWIVNNHRDLALIPGPGCPDAASNVDRECERWMSLADKARASGAVVLMNAFDGLPHHVTGNLSQRLAWGESRYVRQVNEALFTRAAGGVHILDVARLAEEIGLRNWVDAAQYHSTKIACGPLHLPDLATLAVSVFCATRGLSKKCLVLDLDHTLWGGVIGDDGLQGIELGQGSALGEAYVEFQRFVQTLKERGVILAVCSKNDPDIARTPFERHPEMVLTLDDISCFVANWNSKSDNIREIASRLNVGLDSLVFFDDNPAERGIVRRFLPEVAVPGTAGDPSRYIDELMASRHFETVEVSDDDLRRTEMYKSNLAREVARDSADNYDDYLKSLNMTARVGPIDESSFKRALQLVNKSNQFNLTTRRLSHDDLDKIVKDAAWRTLTVSLEDLYGNNGLISVVLMNVGDGNLEIDNWVMSCRVLNRGVEALIIAKVLGIAKDHHCRSIVGKYRPTDRNEMVRDLYGRFGFHLAESTDDLKQWVMDVGDDTPCPRHYINEVKHG